MRRGMLQRIRDAVKKGDYEYSAYAIGRQIKRGITSDDIELAIGRDRPEVIEDYPDDPRGARCLIRGECSLGVLHVVCESDDPIIIVTCYWPGHDQWHPGFRRRKRPQ